ncbi:MAG: hypothetical protein IKR86_12110 [Candidatus Methanomethylophilaceae archaeon]|nr:hypothetical protein [Candidatus Methanomethylophilaceae archaeon]
MTKIEFQNVDFGYDADSLVLHDINLTIDKPASTVSSGRTAWGSPPS